MEPDGYFPDVLLQAVVNDPAISIVSLIVLGFIFILVIAFLSASEDALFSLSPDAISEAGEEKGIKERLIRKKARLTAVIGIALLMSGAISCADSVSTPKPRGFYRIDLPESHYMDLSITDLPCSFNVSHLVTVELPPVETSGNRMNLAYTTLNAKIYCSYQTITPAALSILEEESRELVARNAGRANEITEKTHENHDIQVYGTLFRIEGETISPVQFMLTDSTKHFFRGALYYDCKPNVDSLAPVTQYLTENVIELIQSFHWK